jgi:hypothetical protein
MGTISHGLRSSHSPRRNRARVEVSSEVVIAMPRVLLVDLDEVGQRVSYIMLHSLAERVRRWNNTAKTQVL